MNAHALLLTIAHAAPLALIFLFFLFAYLQLYHNFALSFFFKKKKKKIFFFLSIHQISLFFFLLLTDFYTYFSSDCLCVLL